MFPSPLGVIFSLIFIIIVSHFARSPFPSPLGVIFSLIYTEEEIPEYYTVSVSSRSYILSYEIKSFRFKRIGFKKVSVSSRSYILSYDIFIFINSIGVYVSVSSRSYILSYYFIKWGTTILAKKKFPSPLGVIFSLILYSKNHLFIIVYKAIIVWLFKF